ncbi:MAG: ATP-binding protein, partial [Pseudomonadota bacterium]
AGGSGLGLSIVRWIVEAHGGKVTAGASTSGARVSVSLPAAEDLQREDKREEA